MSRNNTTNYEPILPLKGGGGSVAVLISGGVDSAVVVHLLCEAGLKPDLHYIRIGMDGEDSSCTAEEDIELSQATARKYGLKLEVTDLQKEYWEQVVGYTIERIKMGLTPNPDVMCNRLIKFGAFSEKRGKDYDLIATGHYAQTETEEIREKVNGDWVDRTYKWLCTSPDPVKDQTDFLAQIYDWQLKKALFPGKASECQAQGQSGYLLPWQDKLQRLHPSLHG